jgi:hypothetical protein
MLNARGALEWRERFQQESASPGNQAPLELEQVAAKLVGGSELLPFGLSMCSPDCADGTQSRGLRGDSTSETRLHSVGDQADPALLRPDLGYDVSRRRGSAGRLRTGLGGGSFSPALNRRYGASMSLH